MEEEDYPILFPVQFWWNLSDKKPSYAILHNTLIHKQHVQNS